MAALQQTYRSVKDAKTAIRIEMRADGHNITGRRFVGVKAFGPNQGRYYTLSCPCGVTGNLWSKDKSVLYTGITHD